MRMRIVLAMAACGAMLATAGMAAGPVSAAVAAAAGTGSAAAGGYVPHRCYVSNLAARFHGAQAGLGTAASW